MIFIDNRDDFHESHYRITQNTTCSPKTSVFVEYIITDENKNDYSENKIKEMLTDILETKKQHSFANNSQLKQDINDVYINIELSMKNNIPIGKMDDMHSEHRDKHYQTIAILINKQTKLLVEMIKNITSSVATEDCYVTLFNDKRQVLMVNRDKQNDKLILAPINKESSINVVCEKHFLNIDDCHSRLCRNKPPYALIKLMSEVSKKSLLGVNHILFQVKTNNIEHKITTYTKEEKKNNTDMIGFEKSTKIDTQEQKLKPSDIDSIKVKNDSQYSSKNIDASYTQTNHNIGGKFAILCKCFKNKRKKTNHTDVLCKKTQ